MHRPPSEPYTHAPGIDGPMPAPDERPAIEALASSICRTDRAIVASIAVTESLTRAAAATNRPDRLRAIEDAALASEQVAALLDDAAEAWRRAVSALALVRHPGGN